VNREISDRIRDLPPFTDDPIERLRHTLAVFASSPDDAYAVTATVRAVPGHERTGLTFGDLRALLAEVDPASEYDPADDGARPDCPHCVTGGIVCDAHARGELSHELS
jgi:hypothetical protein